MLKMAQQQYIKHLYEVEEKSLNEIAKMTGFNYHTIQKYAYRENWSVEHLPNYAHIEFSMTTDRLALTGAATAAARRSTTGPSM